MRNLVLRGFQATRNSRRRGDKSAAASTPGRLPGLLSEDDDGIVEMGMERRISADEYLAGPETVMRRELVWGVLREPPSPFRAHQGAVTRATVLISEHVLDHALGRVYVAPLDVVFDRPRALVLQPDVMFVSHQRREILHDVIEGPPDLVVEVISEGSRHYDRISKLEWYRQYNVLEYWVIDPEASEIEVIRLDVEPPERQSYRDGEIVRSTVLPGFARRAADFFE